MRMTRFFGVIALALLIPACSPQQDAGVDLEAAVELGVPASQAGCHTASIEVYFVEGHVPFDDIKRMLREQPDALGISVPGMPAGSPGMEQGGYQQAYAVNLVGHQGETTVYNYYPELRDE